MSAAGPGRPAGVRLRPGGPLVWADAGGVALEVGEWVVLSTDGGDHVGEVVVAPSQVIDSVLDGPLPPVVRRARTEERPRTGAGYGATLLHSLGLPSWAVEPGGPASGEAPAGQEGDGGQDDRQHTGDDRGQA